MAYTKAQQDKIDAAQHRLDLANAGFSSNVARYNDWTSSIQGCYKDPFADAYAASTWYNPQKGPCKAAGSCDLSNCKNVIDKLNSDIIPALRAAYNELNGPNGAKANFDAVIAQVAAEVNSDPQTILNNHIADAAAAANKQKWIFATVVVIVIAAGIFIYLKWFKK